MTLVFVSAVHRACLAPAAQAQVAAPPALSQVKWDRGTGLACEMWAEELCASSRDKVYKPVHRLPASLFLQNRSPANQPWSYKMNENQTRVLRSHRELDLDCTYIWPQLPRLKSRSRDGDGELKNSEGRHGSHFLSHPFCRPEEKTLPLKSQKDLLKYRWQQRLRRALSNAFW